jgi:hypothetical protein
MTADRYALKFMAAGRIPSYQGGAPLPKRRWLPEQPDPVLCERGWHACRWEDTPFHIAAELWIVKVDGQIVHGANKIAASTMLLHEQVTAWNERTQRLLAADCAERVLPIFERERPNDDRPRLAIEVARRFADGLATKAELAAAGDAAWAAAEAAAWAAATAAWAAWAAWDAERRWQADRLGDLCGLDPDTFMKRPR